ncbi:MAG: thermonuclease family protein [Candidatus Aminicenantes bacterium]|nr:thermonuclease family protein [Candidatus Aminicenantes bacterium]
MRGPNSWGAVFFVVIAAAAGVFVEAGAPVPPAGTAEAAPPASAVVLYVVDGDSFHARFPDGKAGGVRLIGVNAPEMTDEREDVRAWAFLAKRFAIHQLAGKKIKLEYDWETRDAYGRLLAYVRLPGGERKLFNKLIIGRGFAYAFLKYPFREDYQREFRRAQQEAVREGRGLWRKDAPPEITPAEAGNRLGDLAAVRFRCAEVKELRRYYALIAREGGFQVLVSKSCGLDLSPVSSWAGRRMVVSGIVEGAPGRISIYVCFPIQIQTEGDG